MANDKRFIVKNGLSGPNVRFANTSNATAVMDFNYGTDGVLRLIGNNVALGTLVTLRDTSTNVMTVNGAVAFGAGTVTVNSTFYTATANNSSFAFGKQESQLSVANAVYAQTSNNATYAYGKQESQLSVANAVFATTANNSLFAFGKQETQLSVANAVYAQTSNNATFAYGKQESQLYVANAVYATLAGGVAGSYVANADFAQTANNALFLNGANSQFYTNATNITTGTLAEARLPFRMNQNVRTTDDVTHANGTFTGTVTIGGNLVLTGNLISSNIQTLSVIDPIIKLAVNNTVSDTLWTGFLAHYNGSGNTNNHTGLVRNPSNKEYVLISTYGDEVSVNNNIIVTSDTSLTYANLAVRTLRLGNTSSTGYLDANSYSGTSNNTTFAYGKQESQLSVANAVFATTANNTLFAYGKQESQLRVANAVFATTANNSLFAYGKQESQLSVANAVFATTANNSLFAYGKQENQLSVAISANSSALQGATWQAPLGIGTVTANTGAFTNVTVSGTTVFNGSVRLNGSALIANNSAGNAGQILSSNGTSVYWVNAGDIGGTVSNANNATYAYGKQESQLSVANAVFASTANNALFAYGKQESQLSVAAANTANFLQNRTWETAGAIGSTVANTGAFTNVTAAIANTTNYLSLRNVSHLSAESLTTTSTAQVQIASFSATTYGSAKIYIQAVESGTNARHVTELLVVHNGTTASAAEYGMLFTGAAALALYEVDIVSNNVRILATPASSTSTSFRIQEELFLT
jgi:hypothetical protein